MKKKFLFLLASCILLPCLFLGAASYYKKHLARPYLTVIGFADMRDGIGRQSVDVITALRGLSSIHFYQTRRPRMENIPSHVECVMRKSFHKMGKVVLYEDIFYAFSHNFFEKHFDLQRKDEVRLAYCMVESSLAPERWVHNLNRYFDAVVVPDPFLVNVFKNSGVTLPIFVVPLGLNLKSFLEKPLKTACHTPFIFANFSTCILRKNHETLIEAFYEAFQDRSDVRLWINSKYTEDNLFQVLQEKVSALGVHNIILTNNSYNSKEYLENFEKIDCYVSLSKAEGFSIQPREAMALGIPCILSDNTGQSTICQSGLVKALPCPLEEPAYYEIYRDVFGVRYCVEPHTAAKALQEVYHHYPSYLASSQKARLWASCYDCEHLGALYTSLVRPKRIVLGCANTLENNTLTTTSLRLYEKYKAIL
ncbi:MAG: glycosyltransferase [Chlamydiae bacterium]|nr:glycosyltransferase [Chlamydiota bacterium]